MRNFSISVRLNGRLISVNVVPLIISNKRAYRLVSAHLPELTLSLDELDSWQPTGTSLIDRRLINEIGERIDHHLLTQG